jgi:hypothetical protein
MITNQILEFEIAADVRRAGACIGSNDAKLIADVINQWKCGAIAIVYYSSFGMSRDVEKFRSSVKAMVEAGIHDALITGRQVFLLNMLGNWPAYPELEEPSEPEGYWWMRILYERSTLQVSILAPAYRAYRNQDFWSINNAN